MPGRTCRLSELLQELDYGLLVLRAQPPEPLDDLACVAPIGLRRPAVIGRADDFIWRRAVVDVGRLRRHGTSGALGGCSCRRGPADQNFDRVSACCPVRATGQPSAECSRKYGVSNHISAGQAQKRIWSMPPTASVRCRRTRPTSITAHRLKT